MREAAVATLAAVVLAGCTTRTTVRGTYDEVWNRTQQAVQSARFPAADTAARYQRLELDRASGTLKVVWSEGLFNDSRVLTLNIDPVPETAGAWNASSDDDAPLDRTVTITAWTWAFFGFIKAPDGSTADEVRLAIEREFARAPGESSTPPAVPAEARPGPDGGS